MEMKNWKFFEYYEVKLLKQYRRNGDTLKKGDIVKARMMPNGTIYLIYNGYVLETEGKLGINFEVK
jgi:hypothetical protein